MSGERASVLAKTFRVDRGTVLDIVRRNGGTVRAQKKDSGRRPWRHFTDEEIERMTALWHDGKSQTYIAREFNTAQVVVSRILRAAGVPTPLERRPGAKSGPAHHSWRGGVVRADGGYLLEMVPLDDSMASMRTRMGYVLQHRLVMARAIGRPLDPSETVHHINGVRDDNRLENLQLWQGRHGKGVRYTCADCGSCNVVTVAVGAED